MRGMWNGGWSCFPFGGGWGGGWGGGFGFLQVLLWVAVLGLGAWLLYRAFRPARAGGHTASSPLDVAKRRYAAGEISREDFERLRRDL